jgi:hypothetical protein
VRRVKYSKPEELKMKRSLYLTIALATTLALSAPAAQAGLSINGPALDGRAVALPDGLSVDGASETQLVPGSANGPALDGRRIEVPRGLEMIGAPMGRVLESLRKE